MPNEDNRLPLFDHLLDAPSAFTPEGLIEAVRADRRLPADPAPEVCVLDFDGDLTDWLVASGHATRWRPWACFHTSMETVPVDGGRCGVIARTIGGPYAVLVAEQLAVSGARVILGLTSAGRVSPSLSVPSLVVAASAIRDEGTSYHYLPAAAAVDCNVALVQTLVEELGGLGLPVATGTVWTTDAPYRETAGQLERHAARGVLAVEMQAASLFAFGAARGVCCGVAAHVTNGGELAEASQFDKGTHQFSFEILKAMFRAGQRYLSRLAPLPEKRAQAGIE